MRRYLISIGARNAPRLTLEVMAPDAATAASQHAEMADPGERLEVVPVLSEAEAIEADLSYLHTQQSRERRRLSELADWERAMDQRRGCR